MELNEITYTLRGCIFKVFNSLGPGLLESAYEAALLFEIKKTGLEVRSQVALPMIYESVNMDIGYRIDLLIEQKVLIEIKSVESIVEVHHKQVITYLTHLAAFTPSNVKISPISKYFFDAIRR